MSNARFSKILRENQNILEKFSSDGVDLNQTVEINFISDFADKLGAIACRSALRSRFGKNDSFEYLFLVASYPSHTELHLTIDARLDATIVSEIEFGFGEEAVKFSGSWPTWEFADLTNQRTVA